VDVANASKAVVKAEAQERKKVSEYAYLSSKRAEPAAASAAAASRNEEEEDMDNDEDSGACGKAKARDVETCPICMDERGAGSFVQLRSWSITVCGHSGCYECMTAWIARMKTCPICKQLVTTQGLYEVEAEEAASSSSAAAAQAGAWGNDGMQDAVEEYGTKIAVLVKELGAVHAKGGKAVVFSAWTRLLKLAETALLANGLPTASLVGSIQAKRQALKAFSADASILLVSTHTHTHTDAYTCTMYIYHMIMMNASYMHT
jgi:E3 ubiquitin-protein ligase SHPRH